MTCQRRLSTLLIVFVLSFCAAPAFAQSCAMCYQTVKGTPKEGQRAIGRGILILLFPPMGVMTLGVGAAFRYGRKRDQEQASLLDSNQTSGGADD
jgi:hypothetical protein